MLKLLLGGSGSGKTTLLYQRIRARAEAGEKSILLVPEQFTSSTEARIYRELGDALSGMVESYSFTSLAEHILAVEGGAAVQTLTDAGRAVLLVSVELDEIMALSDRIAVMYLGSMVELATSDEDRLIRAIRDGAQDTVNQAGQQIVQRQLQVAPTLTIRPGFPVRIIVTRDLVFEPAGG